MQISATLCRIAIAGLLLSVVCLATSGCREEARPITEDQQQHMAALRAQLKEQLGEHYAVPVPEATPEQLKRGAELYPQLCAACHGGRGDGLGHNSEAILGRPSSFINATEAAFFSEQARIYIIKKGVPGTAMMGWENVLPESDILALYVYIRSLITAK